MDRRKKNSSLRYLPGIALLLFAAFAVVSTGTAFARYETQINSTANFSVIEPEQFCFGTVDEEGNFTETDELSWKTENGVTSLCFAVSNGSDSDYSERDMEINLRLIASLGLFDGSDSAGLTLSVGEEAYASSAEEIALYSTLYYENGEGWIIRFGDEKGEASWILEGGKHSVIEMTVTAAATDISEVSVIRPQIIADYTD